ncbi:MAG: site-specific integrase [Gammaproteobacteria bacterium]|nr:site-specific integrase [Gammaproteobacteria bacterium]
MGRIKSPGLFKRNGIWHIDKQIDGHRLRESTGSAELAEAERYIVKRIHDVRDASIYGIRPKRIFRQAADKHLQDNQHKASIGDDAMHLRQLDAFIGDLLLEQIHNGTLLPFVKARQLQGRKTKSINLALGVVRHILNLAATEWLDENSLTWLHSAPKIKLLQVTDARLPYPLSWDEQDRLFAELPAHLRQMAMFKVNTGCREQEVCRLRWDWEIEIELLNLKTSVFLIPKHLVKNRRERLVVLNDVAKKVIEQMRGRHPQYVFIYKDHPVTSMNNSAWKRARKKLGLEQVRVHALKHTFGSRLRAAGVSFEDRQDLLGHKSDSRSITTHYSAAKVSKLIEAANMVCERDSLGPVLTLLKQPHKTPTKGTSNKKAATV